MRRSLIFLYSSAAIIIFTILIWYFSVPDNLIKENIEQRISRSIGANTGVKITGLEKGLFFSIHLDDLAIYKGAAHIINASDISVQMNPLYLYKGDIGLDLNGKIGGGHINGIFKEADKGVIKADGIDLSSLQYLKGLGINCSGILSSETILANNSSETKFTVTGLSMKGGALDILPLINSFTKAQGLIIADKKQITVTSLSLEGDKGYARAKGKIVNGNADMVFELMPEFNRLEEFEKMLIKQYETSPGYYVFPYRGKLSI
ncbi:MAG: type II secretion system protein GspN [Nitrospirae bacterium]|nr:type II secretion system protein GspN [Nitrospirota bacterium]